jgi:hypothetical protein
MRTAYRTFVDGKSSSSASQIVVVYDWSQRQLSVGAKPFDEGERCRLIRLDHAQFPIVACMVAATAERDDLAVHWAQRAETEVTQSQQFAKLRWPSNSPCAKSWAGATW